MKIPYMFTHKIAIEIVYDIRTADVAPRVDFSLKPVLARPNIIAYVLFRIIL